MSKSSGSKATSLAAKTLNNSGASQIQKQLAGSVLAQAHTSKVTSDAVAHKASSALNNPHSSSVTKQLAGSVLSQSKK